MPGGDRTGPMGRGPMTGRGAGLCAGDALPGYANPMGGRGRGGGRGWRHRFWATGLAGRQRRGAGRAAPPVEAGGESELDALQAQAESLEQGLQALRQRIEQLQGPRDGD